MPRNPPLALDMARALDPILFARDCGIEPDAKQAEVLTTTSHRVLENCCRQWGKSTITAVKALHEALYAPPAMALCLSPSQRQSAELFKKIDGFRQRIGADVTQESATSLTFRNGSRIIALPGSEKTTRGYSGVTLAILDEAARIEDELIASIRPMLATTDGTLIAMSTPAGRRGWFFEEWEHGDGWEKIEVAAKDCPRISATFLAEELKALGPLLYAQEYENAFVDAESSAFMSTLIEGALSDDFRPFA